jgi:hypothetical protein
VLPAEAAELAAAAAEEGAGGGGEGGGDVGGGGGGAARWIVKRAVGGEGKGITVGLYKFNPVYA